MGFRYSYNNTFLYELRYGNNKPFYVGKTVNPKQREQAHRCIQGNYNKELCDTLIRLRDSGKEFKFVVVKSVPFETSSWHESNLICKRMKQGFNLANMFYYDKKTQGYKKFIITKQN